MKQTGSCLCGRVKIEISGEIEVVIHCHCGMCRKAHGAPYGTFAICKNEYFKLTAADGTISQYESSPDTFRTFCANCGSNLQWKNKSEEERGWSSFAMSLLDTPINPPNQRHTFTDSKAPWFSFCDNHPKRGEF